MKVIEQDALGRHVDLGDHVDEPESACFVGGQMVYHPGDRVADDQVFEVEADAVNHQMGIVHQMVLGLLWVVLVLVPQLEVEVAQQDAVDGNHGGLAAFLFLSR